MTTTVTPKGESADHSPALKEVPEIRVSQLVHAENFAFTTLVLEIYKTYSNASQ